MKTTNNTVLITGGTAGIGLEMAKLFVANGNKVIVTGRNQERLAQVLKILPNVIGIQGDISNEQDTIALVEKIKLEHPDLNLLINNAGAAQVYDLVAENVNAVEKAQAEMLTNYFAIIRLNEKLLPVLKEHKEAAIVNVSSIVAFAPGGLATYSASKAALHSYTQALRIALEKNNSSVRVFELMPPLVNTDFSIPIGGENGMPAGDVAKRLLEGLENNELEIRVGQTEDFYRLYLSSPEEALKYINGTREPIKS